MQHSGTAVSAHQPHTPAFSFDELLPRVQTTDRRYAVIPEPDTKSPDARLGRFEKMQAPAMQHAVVSRAPALLLAMLGAILLALQPCHAATEAAAPGFRAIKPNSGAQPDPPLWAQRQPFGPASRPAHLDYTTFTRVSPQYRIYHNLWYHNQRWYAMLPPEQVSDKTVEEGLSANQPIVRMPIKDMHNFTKQLRVVYVPGNTMLMDFPFQAYYQHLGHWLELAVPMYNVLRDGSWLEHTRSGSKVLGTVAMPNLSKFFNSWVTHVMATAWGPGGQPGSSRDHKPTLVDYADLEGCDKLGWVLFQDVLVVQDRYTHPQRESGFLNPEHGDLWRYDGCDRWISPTFVPDFANQQYARDFRVEAYRRTKWPAPSADWVPGSGPPQLQPYLTLLLPADEEPALVNRMELAEMLHGLAGEFGLELRTVSLSAEASFSSYIDTFSSSAVVVSRHSPALASTVFMTPGAMVLELLPFKWEWHKISMMYYNMTQSIGDIHHFAWRPTSVDAAVYKEPYGRRYKDWYPGECHAKECLTVQANAGIIVDLEAVEALLRAKVPGVLAGKSIQELAEPWPEAV